MDYPEKTTALVLSESDIKDAALFYDYIIPPDFSNDGGDVGRYREDSLLVLPSSAEPIIQTFLPDDVSAGMLTLLQVTAQQKGHQWWALLRAGNIAYDVVHGLPKDETTESNPAIVLSNLHLIDTSDLSWDHLAELRKDTKALKALRRLRMFVYSNYDGKNERYIEDDLHQRIDDYKTTARRWGLDITLSSLQIAVSEKNILALGAFAIALAGGTSLLLAAATGLYVTLGKIGLKFVQEKRILRYKQTDDPIHYLIEVDKASHKK